MNSMARLAISLRKLLPLVAILALLALFPASVVSAGTTVFNADFNSDTVGSPPSASPPGLPAGDSITLTTADSSSILVAGPGSTFATNSVEFKRVAEPGGSPILTGRPAGAPFATGSYRVTWRAASEQDPGYYGFAAILDSGGYSVVTVNHSGSTLVYQDGLGVQDTGIDYAASVSQQFEVDVDLDAKTFDLLVDGVLVGSGRSFQYSQVADLDRFLFEIGGTIQEAYLLDDISVSTMGPEMTNLQLTVDEGEIGVGAFAVPIGDVPIGSIPLRSTAAVEGAPLRSTPLRSTPLRSTPLRSTGFGALPLDDILLSSIPILTEGGWEAILANTPLKGVPLQNITLADVLALSPLPEKIDPPPGSSIQPLTLGDIDLSSTPLRSTRLVSVALGPTPLADIPLPPPNVDPQTDWCNLLTSLGFDCVALGVNVNTTTLLALDIAGVPIESIPFGSIAVSGMNLASAPLRSTPLRSTLIATTPLRSTLIKDLAVPGDVVDCTIVDCTASSTQTMLDGEQAGAILASATLGDLLDNLPAGALDSVTLGQLLLGFLGRSDYPWETLPLDEMGVQDFAGIPQTLHYHLSFTNSGTDPADNPVLSVDLPEGFRYKAGTSELQLTGGDILNPPFLIADPSIEGTSLTWDLGEMSVGAGWSLDLQFQAWPGLRLGVFASSASVSAGGVNASVHDQAPVRVTEHFESYNDDPATAPIAEPDVLYISHISSATDKDFYLIPVPEEPGSRISVLLSHLSNDDDLVMYSPGSTPLRSTPLRSTPLRSTPLRSTPMEDNGLNTNNAGDALPPETLQDIALQSLPLRSTSTNRSDGDETIETASVSGETGYYTVQVSGYNGASSDQPYVLRIKVTSPPPLPPCSARSFPFAGEGTADTIPPIAADVNTLFLVNQKQLGDMYGAAQATSVMSALANLAGRSDLGVTGAVIPVEGDEDVAAAYDAWNLNPCSAALANNVVSAINSLVDGIRATHADLRYIVLVGSDEIVPMGRIPDTTQTANESGYAADLAFTGNNALFGSLATQNFLSDDPYGDFDPIPWLDRALFVPDVAVGRVAETPGDIVDAVNQFIDANGTLDFSTAKSLTTAYDFLSDGGTAVDSVLEALLGAADTSELINDTWTRQDLINAFTGALSPPDIGSINAHYDHFRALPAAGNDLFTTADVTVGLPKRVLFSMGCHAGLNVADVLIGSPDPRLRDWAQTYADQGAAAYAANSGYGYGDTAAVALSEQLMLLFAQRLNGSMAVGEALTFAKQEYFAGLGLYGVYDEKALEEAVFYGLPMYQVSVGAGAAAAAAAASASLPTSMDPITGLESASIHTEAAFSLVNRPEGSFYKGPEIQVTHYRPIQPRTDFDVTQPGTKAHGALITGLASTDHPNFNPVFSRPTIDLRAHEPEPDFGQVIFPTAFQTIATFNAPEGERQRLVLIPGQFQATGLSGDEVIGNQRLFTSMDTMVLYSNSTDFTAPTLSRVDAEVVGSFASFVVEATDDSLATVARVLVLFRDSSGSWKPVELARTPGTNRWTGSAPAVGSSVEVIAQAVDDAGNAGIFANKGDPLMVTPPPPPPPGVTVDVSGPHGDNSWLLGNATVTIGGGQGVLFEVSVDGGGFAPYNDPVTVGGDGIHSVGFRGSDGSAGSVTVPIDSSLPTITIHAPANGAIYVQGQAVASAYTCMDASGSGVASCAGPVPNGNNIDTATAGSKTFAVNAKDNAGNIASLTHTYSVVYRFSGFFSPVDNPPTLNLAKAGSAIPAKFSLSGNQGLSIFATGYPKSQRINCGTSAYIDAIEETVIPGSSMLSYDPIADRYVYVWKTDKAWANTCRQLVVKLCDGTEHVANFKFK